MGSIARRLKIEYRELTMLDSIISPNLSIRLSDLFDMSNEELKEYERRNADFWKVRDDLRDKIRTHVSTVRGLRYLKRLRKIGWKR